MGYTAKIVLDSVSPIGARLTTLEVSIPKWVQAELNTHRMLSKNSASSRAIPSAKLLQRVKDDPVIPVWWGKNQKGMQANEELQGEEREASENIWRLAGTRAMQVVESLLDIGLHKQITNRLIEPWMFTTVIVTATEFDNFLNLRVHRAAQPELRKVAVIGKDLMEVSTPTPLKAGEWHLPYLPQEEADTLLEDGWPWRDVVMVCAGRCARVSYLTHDGRRAPLEDLRLAQDLLRDGHMSPFEHAARAMDAVEWQIYAAHAAEQWYKNRIPVGNFWGWDQFRKSLTGEHVFGSAAT